MKLLDFESDRRQVNLALLEEEMKAALSADYGGAAVTGGVLRLVEVAESVSRSEVEAVLNDHDHTQKSQAEQAKLTAAQTLENVRTALEGIDLAALTAAIDDSKAKSTEAAGKLSDAQAKLPSDLVGAVTDLAAAVDLQLQAETEQATALETGLGALQSAIEALQAQWVLESG